MSTIKIDVFEGPLELLLHLIEKKKLDITAVSLAAVVDQYLEYLHSGEAINHEALSEFIAIAARLLLLKSRSLLPRPAATEAVDEEPSEEELVQLLMEYRRFKEAAAWLRAREEAG